LARVIEIDPQYQDNAARTAMLRIFNILGEGHELIAEFRPLLNRYKH
ncbi:MAG: tetratricopeptide repeat protein, partial [Gammaproteobacteria bacterium]|nr:tetratricopeptide repeat protein [Gammaproteobacteria bacterium]